jgi:hypothetical protein
VEPVEQVITALGMGLVTLVVNIDARARKGDEMSFISLYHELEDRLSALASSIK